MNERIEKLISKAIKAIPDHVDFDLPKEFTEKFAELIVKETMQVVANQLPSNQYLDVAHAVIEHYKEN
jgi:uncharacterized FlaG/YvyC family protein